MPEGDTVWNTARVIGEVLKGQVVERSDFRVPRLATADPACRGKHLLLRFTRDGEPGRTLHSHLRMDGTWRTYKVGERWSGRPAHLIRVALHTPSTVGVGYHLHELEIVPTAEESRLV